MGYDRCLSFFLGVLGGLFLWLMCLVVFVDGVCSADVVAI